jgi:hypothetical protein
VRAVFIDEEDRAARGQAVSARHREVVQRDDEHEQNCDE